MSRNDLRTLWQQSRNFRRLGYIVFCLALLLLSSRFFTSGQQAPVSSTSPPAQYQAAAGNLAPAAVSPASVPLAAATISEQPLELPPNAKGLGTAETGNVPPHLPTLQNIVASADLGELAQYPPLQDPWGDTLALLPEGEGVITATLDPVRLHSVRTRLPALSHRIL